LNSGVGEITCNIHNKKIVTLTEDTSQYAFDFAFGAESSQIEIYEAVGKETVTDVMSGYNGTILAYGQTGSGKTHTMFGPDIYDSENKGIIPRVANDIFNFNEFNPDTKEFLVSCSMLEIYKENLRDLLIDSAGEELKIKESPQRGIYVEGLTEFPIGSEEELMYWIEQGESRRAWAETRHNSVSSRSHALFMLEVKQIMANDSETRGILNLVDLAGCEKVGKSGVHGQTFEEGTKINLSLSALGNVIHALTTGSEHVPYRDSKLTRLLQESLGGNYKTTLIVTCSPHSSQFAETQSTLKFAQRAKKIKNEVRVNVKSSPNQLLKIIEQLKQELQEKTIKLQEISCTIPRVSTQMKEYLLPISSHIDDKKVPGTAKNSSILRKPAADSFAILNELENSINITNNKVGDEPTINISTEILEEKLSESEKNNSKLLKIIDELKDKLDFSNKDKFDLEQKLRSSELKLLEERKKVITLEEKFRKIDQNVCDEKHKKICENTKTYLENLTSKMYNAQINSLTKALEDAENECFKLIKEKQDTLNSIELYKAKEEILISPDLLFKDSFSKINFSLDEKKLLLNSEYSAQLCSAVEDGVNPETLIYLLKNKLIEASLVNRNLSRIINILQYKLLTERTTANVKTEMGDTLQKTVDSLESLLKETVQRSEQTKHKLEKFDYDLERMKFCIQQAVFKRDSALLVSGINRPKIVKPINVMALRNRDDISGGSGSVRHAPKRIFSGKFSLFQKEANAVEPVNNTRNSELENALKEAQIEQKWSKTLSDLLMEELAKCRTQIDSLKMHLQSLEKSSERAIQQETENWINLTHTLKVFS